MVAVPPVVEFPEQVTIDRVDDLARSTDDLLRAGAKSVVLDLSGVAFLSSGGLSWIVRLGEDLASRGGGIALVRPRSASVRKVLSLVGIDRMVPTEATAARAAERLAAGVGGEAEGR
jgi:anti-sigma B factor antagonist